MAVHILSERLADKYGLEDNVRLRLADVYKSVFAKEAGRAPVKLFECALKVVSDGEVAHVFGMTPLS